MALISSAYEMGHRPRGNALVQRCPARILMSHPTPYTLNPQPSWLRACAEMPCTDGLGGDAEEDGGLDEYEFVTAGSGAQGIELRLVGQFAARGGDDGGRERMAEILEHEMASLGFMRSRYLVDCPRGHCAR